MMIKWIMVDASAPGYKETASYRSSVLESYVWDTPSAAIRAAYAEDEAINKYRRESIHVSDHAAMPIRVLRRVLERRGFADVMVVYYEAWPEGT